MTARRLPALAEKKCPVFGTHQVSTLKVEDGEVKDE